MAMQSGQSPWNEWERDFRWDNRGDASDDCEFLDEPSQIAKRTGYSTRQIKDAIHAVKNKGLPRSGPTRNPDVAVDPRTGEVRVKLSDGSLSGDPIGNILEYLP